jgi:hypothetical protein
MGILKKQVGRLQRTDWNGESQQNLVNELIAIFSTDEPVEIDSGLAVSDPSGKPPINITTNYNNAGNQVTPIAVTIGGISVPTIPAAPGTTPLTTGSSTTGSANAYGGVVISGSGSTYTCSIVGISGVAANVSVNMPALGASATLDPGTPIVVIKSGASYFGFPSVFYGQ